MRPCCIRFTLGHGAELEKEREPSLTRWTWGGISCHGLAVRIRPREVFCFPFYLDLAGSCSFRSMSLAPGFFDVNHRRDAAFIEIIIGRGRHPDSKAARRANLKCLDTDFSWISPWTYLDLPSEQPPDNCLYTLPRNGPNSSGLCFYPEVYLPQPRFAHVRLGRTRTYLRPQWVAWDTNTNKSQSIPLHRSQGNTRKR
ncbi:hypothetical protein EDB82DRAFT_156537 [Fusarium venenatum]|uniref:uncharacterized protein n=1 Tax=Fusarium venenatum TaxID=56646 RepID=UPI001D627DAF|nr:hypothetical protein EDB82DRAFT_156537 [Fusarium venenatum]